MGVFSHVETIQQVMNLIINTEDVKGNGQGGEEMKEQSQLQPEGSIEKNG